MEEGACKALGKRALTPLALIFSQLLGSLSLGNEETSLSYSFWLPTLTLARFRHFTCVSLLNTMASHWSLEFISDLLGSLPRGVGDDLACYAICDSSILLWVVNKSTLEASYFICSSCFCRARSTLSNISSRLDFRGYGPCWRKGGLWNLRGIGLALA